MLKSLEEEIARFKELWAGADEKGLTGHRVEFALLPLYQEAAQAQDYSVCVICHGQINCISAPGDFWWVHTVRTTEDGEEHDASPAGWVHEAAWERHKYDYEPS